MTTATINGVQVQITSAVRGPRGFSNYELWIEAGNTGTVEDYLSTVGQEAADEAVAAVAETLAADLSASASAKSGAEAARDASVAAKNASVTAKNDAEAARDAAAASATSAANLLDSLDDRYLGPKSADPVVDNDGSALISGALYFNTTSNAMKVYNAGVWSLVTAASSADLANASDTAKGSALVGYRNSTVFAALDEALPIIRAKRPIFGFIGDSRPAQGVSITATGGGTSTKKKPNGINAWLEFLSRGAVLCPSAYNKAVSSSLISDLDAQLTLLLALNAPITHIAILSGTNSFANGVSASTGWSQYAAVISRIRAAGITPVCIMDLPRQLSTWLAANSKQSQQFNRTMALNAPALGAFVVDPRYLYADVTNANGDPIANFSYDGIHPATLGAFYIAKAIWDTIGGLFQASLPGASTPADSYDAVDNPYGNIIARQGSGYPFFIGSGGTNTGGGASGAVAAGWNNRVLSGNGTSVASQTARTDGRPGNFQQFLLSAADITTYRFSLITNPAVGTYYAVGDQLRLALDLDVSNAIGLEGLFISVQDFDGNVTVRGTASWGDNALINSTYYPLPAAFSGRAITDPVTIIASAASLLIRIEARVNNGGANIKMGGAELRRI